MKTLGLSVLVLFLSSGAGFAQGPVTLGVAAGGVFSRPIVSEDALPITSFSTTFASAGAVVRLPLEGGLFLQVEPAFLRKGVEMRATLYGYTFALNARADYLEIPVMLGLSMDLGPFSPYALIGPSLAYKFSESWDPGFAVTGASSFYTRYDVSLNAGAGCLWKFAPPVAVLLEARYSLGMNQVSAEGSGRMHSSDFRLEAGLLFGL